MKYLASVVLEMGSCTPPNDYELIGDTPESVAAEAKKWFLANPPPFGLGGKPTKVLVTDGNLKAHVFDFGDV